MNAEKLKNLETQLTENESFSEILGYFMDNFAEARSFTSDSKKVKAPLLQEMLQQAAIAFFKKIPINLTGYRALLHERLNIFHGGGIVEGTLFTFFYCKRINKGMMTIVNKGGGVEMIRITPRPVDNTKLDGDFMENVVDFEKQFRTPNPN